MDKKEIEVTGKKIGYRTAGTGQPVILIHGFGEDGDVWVNQAALLAQKFRVIVPDLPGSGASGMVADMSMEGLSTVIKTILDHENITSCIMIGHSMGGYITLAFAASWPGRLKAFGLFHSTAYADSAEKKTARRKGIDFINDRGAFEFLKNTTPTLFSQKTREERPGLIDTQINLSGNFSASALVSYYEGMIQRTDKTMVLRGFLKPVLFIAGKADNAIPLHDILKQCHLPSLSYIHTLDHSGHMGMLEEPAKTNQVLEKFIREAADI